MKTRITGASSPTRPVTPAKFPGLPALFTLLGLLASLAPNAGAQTYTLSNAWNVAAGTGHITTDNGNRGVAYSVISNQVFVGYRAAAASGSIDVYDGTSGALLSGSGGVTGASLGIDQVTVADDGILYGAPLATGISTGAPYTVYAWTNWNTAPYVAYSSTNASDPVVTVLAGKRVGDSMAITGAGANTLILAAGNTLNSYVLLSTSDGVSFTATVLTNITGLPTPGGGVTIGLAFYTNNTFLVKPESSASAYLVQYPANFASLPSPVTVTVLTNIPVVPSSGSSYAAIAYAPAGSLLGVITNSSSTTVPTGVLLYSLTNFTGTNASLLASTSFASTAANGNLTEGVALGGSGKTNWLYALDSNNGLHAYKINFTIGAVAPSIATQPAGVSGAYLPQTLSVTASGTAPLAYQWQINTVSNQATASVILGATNSTYLAAIPGTNYYDVVITNAGGSITSSVVLVALKSPITNAAVTPLFSINNGTAGFNYLQNDDATRGLAYDAVTTNLVVASRSGGLGLYIVNANTGVAASALNTTGMNTAGTFSVDQVGIGDDGVVYAGNLALAGQFFNLTSWSSVSSNAVAFTAFTSLGGDPMANSGERWGDTMAVRGSGANTQILLGSRGTNVALLTTTDGINFTPTVIGIGGVSPGFAGYGVAFGAGNTFWAKNNPGGLYEIAFDPATSSNSVVFAYSTSQFPSAMAGLGVDPVHNILAGVQLSDQNNDLQLFQLTGNSNAPVLFDQAPFPVYLASDNGNGVAAVAMKYPRVYALDVDNGIIGLTYGVPASTAPGITAEPVGGTIYTADPSFTISPSVSGTLPLYYQWQYNSVSNLATASNISGATGAGYTFALPSTAASGWYDVIVTNFGGSTTSTPVLVTVIAPVTNSAVSPVWSLAPGSRSYLDNSTYSTRGLAYDTNTSTLVLSDHANTTLYVLDAATGNDLFSLAPSGLTAGTFPIDQVGVSDDGVLYFGNLAITAAGGTGDVFYLYSYSAVNSGANGNINYSGDPGTGAGERWGDTMAIRGSGAGTQILLGSYGSGYGPGTNVALLTTSDGVHFTALTIPVPGVTGGFSSSGIAFGAGNTFWAKGGHNFDLRQVAFDPTGNTAAVVLQDYSSPTQTPVDLAGIGVDAANNILAGVCLNDIPNDLQFYLLTGTTNAPILFDQAFFTSANANSQDNAKVVLKFPKAFALDVNNGLIALTYAVPTTLPITSFKVTAAYSTTGGFVLSWPSALSHNYQVESVGSLPAGTWNNVGTPISGTGGTLSYTNNSPAGSAAFYRVIGK